MQKLTSQWYSEIRNSPDLSDAEVEIKQSSL